MHNLPTDKNFTYPQILLGCPQAIYRYFHSYSMVQQKLQAAELFIFDLDGTLVEFHHEYLFNQAHAIIEKLSHPPIAPDVLENFFSAFDF